MNSDFLSARLRKQVGLEWEEEIIWLKAVKAVDEKRIVCKNRTKKPGRKNIVGYTTLMGESPNNGQPGCFNRRVFMEDANGVSPDKVFPGVPLDKCR
jgi:hypothetical protein